MTADRRLVLFRLSSLGDVIHTLPAAVALSDAAAWDEITWVVEPAYAALVGAVAGVRTLALPLRRWRKAAGSGMREAPAALRALRSIGAGTAIDFQGLPKSAVLMALSGAPVRWTFDSAAIRDRSALLFGNRRAAVDHSSHVIEWNLSLASAAAGRALAAPPLDFSRFAEPPGEASAGVLIHAGSAQPRKVWPAERFIELARRLSRDTPVMILWGPGEELRARQIAEHSSVRMAPATTLPQMAGLVAACRLFIGGDSGPLHLAAAMGRPVVGLYGPTAVGRNGPWGQEKHCIVAPDGRMESIEVRLVAEVAEGRLRNSE